MKEFEVTKRFISFDIKNEEKTKKDYCYWVNRFLEDAQKELNIKIEVFPNAFSHGIEGYGFNPIRVSL